MTNRNLPSFESPPDLTPEEQQGIIAYCTEEVRRQYYGRTPPDYAVPGMLRAWEDALRSQFEGFNMTPPAIERWGRAIEPVKNAAGFRSIPIFVGHQEKLNYRQIDRALYGLCEAMREGNIEALDAYREFEEIHPFEDGNGRTGKIILNWMNGTLVNPIFPPDDFWGERYVNP